MNRVKFAMILVGMVLNGAQAASVEECLENVKAIKRQVTQIAMFQLPAMALESNQGPGYQMQYGVMLGTTSANRSAIISQLESACRDAIDMAALVKEKEVRSQ